MQINWIGYQYDQHDGYGRFGSRMIQALQRAGVQVAPLLMQHCAMPSWMQDQLGLAWDRLTISGLPPYFLKPVPGEGPHWLLSMTEGSQLPDGWAEIINRSGVERVIVPCEHNAAAFREGGVCVPVHVVPGGTDPEEFPLRPLDRSLSRPYTFLCLGDRGGRKGWTEVWSAFYKAFGPSSTGVQDVRLIIKLRLEGNPEIDVIAKAGHPDPRIVFQREDIAHARDIYAQADCFVIPSLSEGWGMPHREAAMMGVPVITQCHSGLDDGHTHEWATVVEGGRRVRIPSDAEAIKGEWVRADTNAVAAAMRRCYDNPLEAAKKGQRAALWLREHQTWDHAAAKLIELMRAEGALEERQADAALAEFA
ncbi:MAG: glycosyltransferase family 4 protein [Caldilineaceae bacterium]|nr:glycosyltransferase family 4 protein [Caldilineaceae bacterium]